MRHDGRMQWLAVGEPAIPEGTGWLSPAEAARAATMRFTKRRTEYRLRRLAAKRAVSAVLGRPVDERSLATVEVLNRRGGAPFVTVDGADVGLEVSLTDRAGWAVCLVGVAAEFGRADSTGPPAGWVPGTPLPGSLGVDLEAVEPRSTSFVADYFTTTEQEWTRAQGAPGSEGWQVATNLVWSAKESALKVLRVGLRADTRVVEITVGKAAGADGWAPLTARTVRGDVFPGWWRRDGHFLLTLASTGTQPPPHLLPAGDDLASGTPMHTWLARPLAD